MSKKFTKEDLKVALRAKGVDPDTVHGLDWFVETQEPVELDPELQECVVEREGLFTFIHHPLLVTPYSPFLHKEYNENLEALRKQVDKYLHREEYGMVIFTYARPFRTDAFDTIMESHPVPDREYWEILAAVWVDQENPEDYSDEWRVRFSADREDREYMMHEEERQALSELPEVVTVYRGDISEETTGLSWSTSRKVAEWFAKRFGENYTVYEAKIRRENIDAYWTRRNEFEVLVTNPDFLEDVREAS